MNLDRLLDAQRKGERHDDAAPKLVMLKISQETAEVPKGLKHQISEDVAAALNVKKIRIIVTEIKAGNESNGLEIIVIIMPGSSPIRGFGVVTQTDKSAEYLARSLVDQVRAGKLPQFDSAHVHEPPPAKIFDLWREHVIDQRLTREVCRKYVANTHKREMNVSFSSWRDHIHKGHRNAMLVKRFSTSSSTKLIKGVLTEWRSSAQKQVRNETVCQRVLLRWCHRTGKTNP
jgi:hypothetical protein